MKRLDSIGPHLLNKIIIIFWAAWWLIAFWTDIVGSLAHLNVLHASWAPDTNFPFLVSSLRMYNAPKWLAVLLYLGIIGWSFLCTAAFTWTACSLHKHPAIWRQRAQLAFILSLTFWFAFFLSDQIVMKFDLEENHMVQGGFALLTYLCLFIKENNTYIEQ